MRSITDPGFGQGEGASSDLPKQCVIWASEYNLGPQKWGVRGAQPPQIHYWRYIVCVIWGEGSYSLRVEQQLVGRFCNISTFCVNTFYNLEISVWSTGLPLVVQEKSRKIILKQQKLSGKQNFLPRDFQGHQPSLMQSTWFQFMRGSNTSTLIQKYNSTFYPFTYIVNVIKMYIFYLTIVYV